jgi:cytochrome P450
VQPPFPDQQVSRQALKGILQQKSILGGLEAFHRALGDVFQITLPGFSPIVFAGPDANRFILVNHRHDFLWRVNDDPVVRLLRHGVLIEDGEAHDRLRERMNPSLHRHALQTYVPEMVRFADQITDKWQENRTLDMLVEMRKIALLTLVGTLFDVDLTPHLDRLFPHILKTLKYISPGTWLIWPQAPRLGYKRSLKEMDAYLYNIITARRDSNAHQNDLLTSMVHDKDLDDDLIRDQLLTMLIAGHDTSTALLAWSLYLLGAHPPVKERLHVEVDDILGDNPPNAENISQLRYLNQVIKETLRLYPPIHAGNRIAAVNLEYQNYTIPAGSRVMYSIYLTHRHPDHWPDPERFEPERFSTDSGNPAAYTYLPFGGGPRNCIGGAYAQVEAKVILARLLQKFEFELLQPNIHAHMGATLEPRPGVFMQVEVRKQ